MNKMRISIAASCLMIVLSPIALAKDRDVREVTVNYGELNLSSEGDANLLYKKLRMAARQACGMHYGRELRQRTAFDVCYSKALSNAVTQVNRNALTSLHERATKG